MLEDECDKFKDIMISCVKKYNGTFRCRKEVDLYYNLCYKKIEKKTNDI
jgi:hypothetical protein